MEVHAPPAFPVATETSATRRAKKTAPGEPHIAAPGISENGTSSYCVAIPDPSGQAWAACVDPACWYWITKGFLREGSRSAFVCPMDRSNDVAPAARCHGPCATACARRSARSMAARSATAVRLASRVRESVSEVRPFASVTMVAGAIHRARVRTARRCNPTSSGPLPDVRCGDMCDPGTSRCSSDRDSIRSVLRVGQVADRSRLRARTVPRERSAGAM